MSENEILAGGQGELPSVVEVCRADMVLIRRAINGRFPMPDIVRAAIVNQMYTILTRSSEERNKIAASRVLKDLDKMNMAEEDRNVPAADPPVQRHQHEHRHTIALTAQQRIQRIRQCLAGPDTA